MAEWAILIMVFGVIAGAYALSRRFFETWQIITIWCVAGLVMTIGLVLYVFSKVNTATAPWGDRYEIQEP